MSTIATTGSPARDALLSPLRTGSTAGAHAASPASGKPAPSVNNGGVTAAAAILDLSEHAKAVLERAKSEQVAADKLAAQVLSASQADERRPLGATSVDDGSSLYGKLTGRAHQQTDGTKWQAGAPYGNSSISDAEFTAELKGTLLQQADEYDKRGLAPEVGQALRNAVANGALKFQKASDVPDLNFQSSHAFTTNAFGTLDGWGSTSQNPTGATKAAIDQGKAIAMWSADRGDVYITW